MPPPELPLFMTADEVAALLRTSRESVHGMEGRGLLPVVVRIGRRVLFLQARQFSSLAQGAVTLKAAIRALLLSWVSGTPLSASAFPMM